MPRKDKYHEVVRVALEKDGWTITDDPLTVQVGVQDIYIDLAAEKDIIGAEKNGDRIAIEIKSMLRRSQFFDYYASLGQFLVYRLAIERTNLQRVLFLAIPASAYSDFLKNDIFQEAWKAYQVNLLIFDSDLKIVAQWIRN